MKYFHFKILLFFFLVPIYILSQNEIVHKIDTSGIYRLSDVVISATKTSTSTLELANSITVIDSAEIANRNKINVFDLLKTEYGVSSTQSGGLGSLSNVNIRGGNAEHTLILIDGIEMNMTSDAANVYDFANLPTENISRIEILRGPQSTLYGSDALAGVINIITKKGSGKPSLLISAEGGSYNTFKGNAEILGSLEKLNYSLSIGRTQSNGISAAGKKYGNIENDGYEGNNFSSRIGYDFNDFSGINFFFRFTKADTDLDQFGGEFGDDPTYKYNLKELTTRAEGFFAILDGMWEQKIGVSFYTNERKYNYDSTINNPASSNSLYDGKKYQVDWQNNIRIGDINLITAGIDFEIEQANTEFYLNSAFGPFESVIPNKEINSYGFYIQDQLSLNNNFFATAGFRYDHYNIFGGAFTYRIAPAYIFWETGTKIKATIATGFKAPSIFYLYDPFSGNIDLNPEKNFGWDAGIEQFLWSDGISIGINYFSNNFTDLFGTDENFKTINIEEATANGIELFTKIELPSSIIINANYTFTNTEDKSEGSPDKGMQLIRRPEHKAGIIINYGFLNRTNVNLEVLYVGKKDDKNFSLFPAERIVLNDYTLINISANYDLLDFLRINARVENILDVEYEEIFGFGTPSVSVYAGFRIIL